MLSATLAADVRERRRSSFGGGMMKPAAAAKGAIGRLGQMLARAMPTSSGSGTASSRRASAAGGEPSPWHWWGLLTRRPQRQEDPREVWALQQRVQLELAEQAAQLAWLEEQRERMLMEAVTSDHSPSATTGAGRLQQQCGGGASDVRKQGAQPLPAKAAPEPAAAAAAAPLLAVPSEQPLEPVAAPQPVLQPPAVRAVKLLDMNAGNAFFGLRTEAGAEDSEWGLGGSCGDLSVDDDGGMEGSLGGGLEDGAGMEEEALLWGELEPEGGELEEGWDQFGGLVDEQVELTQQEFEAAYSTTLDANKLTPEQQAAAEALAAEMECEAAARAAAGAAHLLV